jgi:FdhD protein
MTDTSRPTQRLAWRDGAMSRAPREVAEEVAVALTYDASTYAVMMATPADLEDFGVGFSLTEGLIDASAEITALEVVASALGIEVRMWLAEPRAAELADRRRRIAGPTGCGLCGIESLEAVRRNLAPVGGARARMSPAQILRAMASLGEAQTLNHATHAVHAAGFAATDGEVLVAREDVGRHNALDKLVGALARSERSAEGGAVVLSSRLSIEMVQKAAAVGAAFVIAASAPTSLAIEVAEQVGLTLIGITRADGFEVFTRPERVVLAP